MPTFDPAMRPTTGGNNATGSAGGTSSANVPSPQNLVNNDLIIVTGNVNTGVQINPPDASWTRINGVTSGFQCFWKRAGSNEPATYTFTWDGVNRSYTFNSLAAYSQSGATVSLSAAVTSQTSVNSNQKTSDNIIPSRDALVLVSYLEFVVNFFVPVGPSGLTLVQGVGGIGSSTFWAGYIYVPANLSSGTFTATNGTGDPNSTWFWGSATFSLVSSVSSLFPPLLTDEAIYAPSVRVIPDIVFCGSNGQVAFPIWSGAQLLFTPPPGLKGGELLIAHIWSNGTAPGQSGFQSIPVGWTFLQGSYLENFARLPPSANWIFYRIATASEPPNYQWLLTRPTLNIWSGIIYAFCNVDGVNPFNGFKALTGFGADPKALSLTPDWRNDVSVLLFAQDAQPGVPKWPLKPDAPAGYVQLAKLQNQGDYQKGYLGVPNSCNAVPDVFDYTTAQQVAVFGGTPFVNAWFSYSFLLKNINVAGQVCAISGGGPGPVLPPPGPPNPIAPLNFPLCPLPGGISGIPLEIQTPAKLLDNGRLGLCSRFFIDINTNNEQLVLTILVDNAEFVYPILVQTANRRTFEAQFQVSGRIYSIRLAGCLSFGRVEFFEAWTDLDEGRSPEVQGTQG